jgi:hypothetical protein
MNGFKHLIKNYISYPNVQNNQTCVKPSVYIIIYSLHSTLKYRFQ